ncbi:MAG: hypothetical protein LBJ93_01065 [Clostridiales bacterium]|jgi:hypothetical protein|nr:hypothetical protein [Clostridiales bacterium]
MNPDTRDKIEHAINLIYDHDREKIEKISTNGIVTIEANGCNVAIKVDTLEPIERAILIMFEIIKKDTARYSCEIGDLSAIFFYFFNHIISIAREKQQNEFYSDSNIKLIISFFKFLKPTIGFCLLPLFIRRYKIEHTCVNVLDISYDLTFEEKIAGIGKNDDLLMNGLIDIVIQENNFEQIKKIGIKDDSIQFVSSPIVSSPIAATASFKDPIKPQLKRNMFIAISSPLIGFSVTVILLGLFNHLFTNFAINLAAIDMLKFLPAALGLILCVIFVIKLTVNKFSRDKSAREEKSIHS